MKSAIAFALFSLFTFFASAQKYTVEGFVHTPTDESIEVASVILLNTVDSVMAGFSITSAKGRFKIDDVPAGRYNLSISYLGYSDHNEVVEVQGTEKSINLGIIKLVEASELLDEVSIVESHIPIKIKKDTVEYNAAAFKTQEQDNVEELLKKLPGVEVADDGTITAHGEEVEKVTVDGKEFFTNDPTIATKNLPAGVVEKLQVFDESSDMAAFTGIDDGERSKTINLVLKEGKKAGYFGKANFGYGTDDRYNGNFNINRFTKDVQMSVIGMSNNVNVQGFSFRDYISFVGGLNNFSGGRGGSNSGLPISNGGLGNGFVNTNAMGANFNWDPSKKVTTNTSYFFTDIENIIDQEIFRENLLGNAGFTTEQEALLNNASTGHSINSTIRAELDSTQRLVTRISARITDGSSVSNSVIDNFTRDEILQSAGVQNIENAADQTNINANVTYLKRLSKSGKYFSLNTRIGYSTNVGLGSIDNSNLFVLPGGFNETVNTLQSQVQDNDQIDYLVKGSYTMPLGGRKYFELNATRRNFNNDFEKDFFDLFPNQEPNQVINDLLSSTYKRDFTYNTAGFNLKFNTNKSNLTVGANLQQSILDGIVEGVELPIEKRYVTFLPKLSYTLDVNATSSFRANYTTNVTEPSLEQLQPIVDNSDPLNIYIGNPELRTANTHQLRLNYNSFSQFSNIGLFSNFNIRYTDNNITNARQIDENSFVTTTTPINTDYAFNISGSVSFNAPVKFLKHRLRISHRLSSNQSFLFINDTENLTNRLSNNVTVTLDNWKKDFIDFEIGARIGFNNTKYSENVEFNQDYTDYRVFTEIDLDFKKDWTFTTNFSYRSYSDEDFGDQIALPIWRASLSKLFGKQKKWRSELAVFDILDQNQNINRTANINYIQDERIESIGQYVMLTFGYNFSGFGQNGGGGGRGRR